MTVTNTPERQRRIADLWTRRPDWTEAEVIAEVEEQLAAEEAAAARANESARELSDNFLAMTTCAVPGCRHGLEPSTGLCERHSRVLFAVEAEAAGAETLDDGRPVRDWIADVVASRRNAT